MCCSVLELMFCRSEDWLPVQGVSNEATPQTPTRMFREHLASMDGSGHFRHYNPLKYFKTTIFIREKHVFYHNPHPNSICLPVACPLDVSMDETQWRESVCIRE